VTEADREVQRLQFELKRLRAEYEHRGEGTYSQNICEFVQNCFFLHLSYYYYYYYWHSFIPADRHAQLP